MSRKHYKKAVADWSGEVDWTYPGLRTAILMSILDELKRLNGLLHCPNFIRIPRDLARIRLNTTKKKRAVKK
jgi:hypothetical protein